MTGITVLGGEGCAAHENTESLDDYSVVVF